MKDLNFFEPYLEKREFKFNIMVLLYALLVICILAVSAYGVYTQFQINDLRAQVEDRKAVAENPATIKKVNEIKELEIEVNNFKDEVNKIIELDNSIESNNKIKDNLLREIRSKMPAELFVTNFSAFNNEIQISGIAKDTYSIAEFSKGLELLEDTDSVFISSINNVEDYNNFVLNLTLKDGSLDGNQTAEE
jgi:type IV pilus assembly protein PilN